MWRSLAPTVVACPRPELGDWLLEFYILATSTVMPGWVLTCNIAHLIFSVLPHWEIRPPVTWPRYITQSYYTDIELTNPSPILLMTSARLWSDKHKCYKSDSGTKLLISHMLGPRCTKWPTAPGWSLCCHLSTTRSVLYDSHLWDMDRWILDVCPSLPTSHPQPTTFNHYPFDTIIPLHQST